MNKSLQIFLIVLLFCVSSAGGYVVYEIVNPNSSSITENNTPQTLQTTIEVDAEPVVKADVESESFLEVDSSLENNTDGLEAVAATINSTVPNKPEFILKPQYNNNGSYKFTVKSTIESGDPLKYELYSDPQCEDKVVCVSEDGEFTNVKYSNTGKYYLRAVNCNNPENVSEIVTVSGVHFRYKPLTKEEIENAFNSCDPWHKLDSKFKKRLGTPKVTVINAKLTRDNNLQVGEIPGKFGAAWKSIRVQNLTHDETYGTVSTLEIEVEYDE